MAIDYARMQRVFPRQKAALTRAVNSKLLSKVVETCEKTVDEWDEIGAWPDDWARWRRELDDAYYHAQRDRDLREPLDEELVRRVHELHDRGL